MSTGIVTERFCSSGMCPAVRPGFPCSARFIAGAPRWSGNQPVALLAEALERPSLHGIEGVRGIGKPAPSKGAFDFAQKRLALALVGKLHGHPPLVVWRIGRR